MLRNRSLAALLAAELVSTTGTTMTFLALPWFVLETTGSATRMSLVLAAELVPIAIFGIPSGALVGRLGARRTMLLGDALRAPLIALVPVLQWTGHLSFGLLLASVFALGLFSAPYFASQRTIVPELFGDDETVVAKASALLGGATQLTIVFGPAVGGVLVSWFGAPGVLLLDGVTYLVAFALVALLVRGGRPLPQTDETRGILAGVRYLASDPVLGPLTLTVIVLDMAGAAIAVAIPLLAFVRYDENPHVAGWLFDAFGVGAVAGSVLVMKLLDRFRPLRLANAGIVLATLPLWARPSAGAVAGRRSVGVRVRRVRALRARAGAGPRHDAPTCRAAREGDEVRDDRERARRTRRTRRRRPDLFRAGPTAMFLAIAAAMSVGAALFVAAASRGEPAADASIAAAPVL